MNSFSAREQHALDLVDIIDFKWLMAHEGHRIHVERIQHDRDYASACIAKASASSVVALREVAHRVARSLSL